MFFITKWKLFNMLVLLLSINVNCLLSVMWLALAGEYTSALVLSKLIYLFKDFSLILSTLGEFLFKLTSFENVM